MPTLRHLFDVPTMIYKMLAELTVLHV